MKNCAPIRSSIVELTENDVNIVYGGGKVNLNGLNTPTGKIIIGVAAVITSPIWLPALIIGVAIAAGRNAYDSVRDWTIRQPQITPIQDPQPQVQPPNFFNRLGGFVFGPNSE